MRCVRFKHLNFLLYPRLTAVIACWLPTRPTSGISPKNLHQVLHWKSNMPQSVAEGDHLALGRVAPIGRKISTREGTHCQTSG